MITQVNGPLHIHDNECQMFPQVCVCVCVCVFVFAFVYIIICMCLFACPCVTQLLSGEVSVQLQ